MKKLFSASILLLSLTNIALAASMPPIPDPTEEMPPLVTRQEASAVKAMPPIPDPTEEMPPAIKSTSL
jgi:hypothetical protein